MVELGSDVFLGRLDQAIVALQIGIVLVHQAAGRFSLPDPFPERGQVGDRFRIQQGLHDGTIGMATHDDVENLQDRHHVFDRGRAAALHRTLRRHHVASVSENKELAVIGLCEEGGVDS